MTSAATGDRRALERVQRMSKLLDGAVRVPFTKLTFGIDPLIGLIPVGGDLVSLGLSAYVIWQARRAGASRKTLTAMIANTGLDALAGAVPIAGDAFDFFYKANARNLKLLERQIEGESD